MELLLRVRRRTSANGFDRGDIVCAFNRRRILWKHAETICHHRRARRNRDGLLIVGSVCQDYFESFYQFRFERVSASQHKRVTIRTGGEELFDIDPTEFLARRRAAGIGFPIFGTVGREIWYGGRKSFGSMVSVSNVWDQIEIKTPEVRTSRARRRWPLSPRERREFLAIPVDNFTDSELEYMESPEVIQVGAHRNGDPIYRRRRKRLRWVDWDSLLPLESVSPRTRRDIEDESLEIDVRERLEGNFVRSEVVQEKL